MEAIIMAAQLLLGLTILVAVHELGHMLTAKYFGMRVEKFSIGFPPKVVGFTKGETEYSIGAIPLGGFVKISGMVDESLDTAALSREPEPYEFRAKPAWQRLIVMMGGIIVNIITGIIIFVALTYIFGESFIPMQEVNKRGIVASPLAEKIGLKTGDKILSINGNPISRFEDIYSKDALLSESSYFTIERNGKLNDIHIPPNFINEVTKEKERFVSPIMPFKVGQVIKGNNAEKAGLKTGDEIININKQKVTFFHELQSALQKNKGKVVSIDVKRGENNVSLKAKVDENGRIGFAPEMLLTNSVQELDLGQSIQKGTANAFEVIFVNAIGLGKIVTGKLNARDSLTGPIGMAAHFGGTWDWHRFWTMVGMLSMVLAFMNFLPIPALDGGHVMFLTYEMISGKKPSDKFLEIAQKVGMIILLSLMVFAFGNDILKLLQ